VQNQLQTIVDKHDIAVDNAKALIEAFGAPFTEAGEILASYQNIEVTDASQTELMAEARTKRLALKKVRTTVENKRKALKEDSLRTGKAIDSVARLIKDTITPAEEYLEQQEKFAEIQEAKRQAELKNERIQLLQPYCDDYFSLDLGAMSDDEFKLLLEQKKEAHQLRKAQEEAYEREQERIRAEKEAEEARIREENEILKKQLEAKEAEIEKEREELEEVQRAQIATVRTEAEQRVVDGIITKVNALTRSELDVHGTKVVVISYDEVIEILNK
jgi:hypothetical protein